MFKQVHIVASVKCRWPFHPGYMHSFGMTERYFVIVEQPLSVSLSAVAMNRFKGDPLSSALKWFKDCPVSNKWIICVMLQKKNTACVFFFFNRLSEIFNVLYNIKINLEITEIYWSITVLWRSFSINHINIYYMYTKNTKRFEFSVFS